MALIANPYAPFPAFTKSWQFSVNQLVDAESTAGLQGASTHLLIKNSLLSGPFTVPWTTRRCCDSVTVKTDGTDLLTDKTKYVGAAAGSAHSWWVGRNASGIEVCWDFTSSTGAHLAGEYMSASAGFTGGTTTARPTATDEIQLRGSTASPTQWLAGSAGVNVRWRFHVLHSTDGMNTVVLVTYQSILLSLWEFGRAAEPVSGWSAPVIGLLAGTASTGSLTSNFAQSYANFYNFNLYNATGPSGGMNVRITPKIVAASAGQVFSATKGSAVDNALGRESGYSGLWGLYGFGFRSVSSGMLERFGKATDKWLTASGLGAGTVLNSPDGNRSVAVIGNWVFPWPTKTNAFFL